MLSRAVSKIFKPADGEEIPDKFKNLSFYKTTMIFCGLEAHHYLAISLMNRKIQEQLRDQNEPKSIGAFIRLTDRLCSHVSILRKSTQTTNLISQNLQNPDQFDLENASIEVKTRLLRRFSRVMLDTGTNQ